LKNRVTILLYLIGFQNLVFSQTTFNDDVMFSTTNQGMFGSGAGFSLDTEVPLIPTTTFGSPNLTTIGGITSVSGFGDFGMKMEFGVWGSVGSKFYIKGINGGLIDVDYPIRSTITYPSANTINRGEWITIETDYVVRNNWKLQTTFPITPESAMGLDFDFNLNLIFKPTICAFGCLPTPNINLSPNLHVDLFKVSPTEIIYPGATSTYNGGCPPPPFYCDSPTPCPGPVPCLPALIRKSVLPVSYDNGIGLTGELDLPSVSTTDNLLPNKCLTASGSYTYFTTNLDVLKFMGNFIPPPAGTVLQNLSNSFDAGPFHLSYNLMSANFQITNTTFQEFEFCPQVKNNFHFTTPVFYEEVSTFGLVLSTGQSQDIIVTSGNNLRIKYPCNYDFMPVTLDYDLENEFSNHTYDELAATFILEAIGFSISMDDIDVFPSITLDPCGGLFGGCSFTIPGLSIPGFTIEPNPNPLLSFPLPIATISYDWFPIGGLSGTWELEGFTNKPGSSFTLDAMPYLANSSGLDVACYGENTGEMEVVITNGVAPFNYFWSDGTVTNSWLQTETNTSLVSGPNNVVVEDVNGCQATTSQLISEPVEELHTYNSVVKNVNCNGNATGDINISVVGGTAPYFYNWFPLVSNSNSAVNLPAGTYSVEVVDSKNCSYTENYTVTEPELLISSVTISQHVSCKMGSDGAATIFTSGGAYPYAYTWSTGDNGQTVAGLPAGNHSCTVTDVNGCFVVVPVIITEPTDELNLIIAQTAALCYNQADGSIDLTPSGGTLPYSFNWYNGSNQLLSQHVEDPVNLLSDTYLVNMLDANGCFDTISITVQQPDELLIPSVVIKQVLCNGDNTGIIDITVAGGTLPYNYLWSNGSTMQDITGDVAGNYIIDVTDANLCTVQGIYEIIEPELPLNAVSINTDVLCFGDNTGSIDLSVSGGTEPYSYVWNNASITEDIISLISGNYSTTITDAHACVLNFNTVINQPVAPLSTINTVIDVTCFDSINGSITSIVSGGTTPYYYQWNTSSEIILADTTNNPQSLGADTYSLVLTDTNNCMLNQDIVVTQPDSIALSIEITDVLCKNDLTGEIDLTVSGGTPNYNYLWSNGSVTQDLTGVSADNYEVFVTDANGCENNLTGKITQPDSVLSIKISKEDVLCHGEATGAAMADVSGGVNPYTILWSNGEITNDIDTLLAGTYTITVVDMNGCIANSGTIINEPINPISFGVSVVDASCFNFSNGEISVLPIGGTEPFTLVYGDTLNNTFNNLVNSYSINGLHAGTYYTRIIDDLGCEYEELITVGEPDSLMVSGVVTDALCYGSADGIVDLTVTGGTTPYSYLWSNSTTYQNLTGASFGWYSVEVTDVQNCLTKEVFFIDQPDDIVISSTIFQTTCRDNEDGSITVYVEGGTPDYDYLWSNNEVTETIYNLAPGTYTIEVMDEHGCIKNDTFILNQSEIDCIQPPTAFTPDGDGINDTWILENINNYENATVQVFNKWGNLLYETNGDYTPWNGYYNGKRLPSATYYYIINLNNEDAPYTGPITIVITE